MSVAGYYDEIPYNSRVVFDWDNTLKIVNKETKRIECSVSPSFLENLVSEKACQLYIISAIRPSRMNMETLLMEVDRLGIRQFFCPLWQSQHQLTMSGSKSHSKGQTQQYPHGSCIELVQGNLDTYVRWGNIVICGHDKAEVFLELVSEEEKTHQKLALSSVQADTHPSKSQIATEPRYIFESEAEDVVDGFPANDEGLDPTKNSAGISDTEQLRPIVFFDDEEVNILNFSKIVKNSLCIWVK